MTDPKAIEAPASIEGVDTTLYVKSMRMDETGAHFEFQSDVIPIIANGLADQMKEMGGINYVGWEFDHTELGPLILTLQRRWGETPERQARDRLVEIGLLQSENERLRADYAARESAIRAEERDRCAKVCTDEADHLRKALGPGDRAMCVATANTIRAHIRDMADEVKS